MGLKELGPHPSYSPSLPHERGTVEFVRLGGLSPVKYKPKEGSEHVPPCKHGIYAFPWPYIEQFLCLWDSKHEKELEIKGFRRFQFDGSLYHHLSREPQVCWTLSTIDEYQSYMKEMAKADRLSMLKDPYIGIRQIDDPYKRGRGGCISRDHLEVFIPKHQLGRIR